MSFSNHFVSPGICPDCISNPELTFAILTWLGWINSSMNPVIYACCSHDFRRLYYIRYISLGDLTIFFSRAFIKILRVCCAAKYVERSYKNVKSNIESKLVGAKMITHSVFQKYRVLARN